MTTPVAIRDYLTGNRAPGGDCPTLHTEREWTVEGERSQLAEIEKVLPSHTWTRVGDRALVLHLLNSVGTLDLPHLGPVELRSGKLGELDFEMMLADLTKYATSLPFDSRNPGAAGYASVQLPRREVLYHVFVYLRYILGERAPADLQLLPALKRIQRAPHRRWLTDRREVRLEHLTRADPRVLFDLVTKPGAQESSGSGSPAWRELSNKLGNRLPETVSERTLRTTVDTPENRFVKAFIAQARTVIDRTRAAVRGKNSAFARNLVRDCDAMEASLTPVIRHSLWAEVGKLRQIPFSSTVLQRRRGYRAVLRHFALMRLAPGIPIDADEMRNLLELKDIAQLYELWTYYCLADAISSLVGPPSRDARTSSDEFHEWVGWNQVFEWARATGRIRLTYNQTFSASHGSYSTSMRPDISLHLPGSPDPVLHLFDAKFISGEALSTLHTYRDAIPKAHSVWILFPGTEFYFYDRTRFGTGGSTRLESPECLGDTIDGVGAIPFMPGSVPGPDSDVSRTLERLLAGRSGEG